jgi:ABC-type antimicrobial peptide transport system permease subunit
VISDNAFEKLSPDGSDITGRQLRAGSLRCTVVGVLSKPPSGALNFNFAPDVLVPASTFARQYIHGSKVYQVQVLVDDLDTMTQTEDAVKNAVSAFNNNKFTYQTFDSRFIAHQLNIFFGVLTMIVGVIGAISLAVAGIGIMNVLLVSITERTREIGVRKAIGARRGQILLQFLLEAALLAFTGCVGGTIAGLAIGWWINQAYIIKISGVIVPIAWGQSVELAVIFATVVTLAFGTYPAYRAAGLDPIEALRYE